MGKEEEEQSLKLGRAYEVLATSIFTFLASACEVRWPVLFLIVSASY